MLSLDVVYAMPDVQTVVSVRMPQGSTVRAAIMRSGILTKHPEIDLTKAIVGVYSQKVPLEHMVQDGDRIEIYRPLIATGRNIKRKKTEQKERTPA